uniref:Uncharacterized protein LOC111105230 isoform X1 n=1 Tax=Crassostrea virginica TaxID=6565 RepID=A0A8B8AUW8_CRAVI|nr:uncharacterized protein LOC111105230 isoform X1 [Crassostrea virginica]XP_022295102.1 uncharacterized protein LOC111105230 isoform X1 [Crassostrea virginica]
MSAPTMRKENTYLPSARKIFQRYERVRVQENVLLVGTVGAGKSATINTITAALSGERKYRAPIGAHLSTPDGTRKRTTTHLMWYRGCGIDESKRKDMHVPKNIPNLVDMTGLENVESREQEKLLEMILMGRIPDETSIPALQDMERTNPGSLDRKFPFIYDPRRIHKILFIASATEPIPTKLIKSVRNVAQPDGSPSNVNPRYIPLFGLMTKEDLVNFEDKEIQDREREFLQSLGIDQTASYSRWQNNPTGDFSCRVLYFLDRLLSPEVRVVLDQIIFIKRWIGSAWENPSYALLTLPLSALGFIAIFWASVYLNLYF